MTDRVAELYEKYNKLAEAKDYSLHSADYADCIEGSKGEDKEKQLAAQIITKFFKHFPSLQDRALNALLDLCEDDNTQTRISAMKQLPQLCKESRDHLFKVADVLAQLLQLDDQDYNVACNCLIQVFKQDAVQVAKAVFGHVNSSADYNLREKCVAFLFQKLIKIPEKLSAELEEILVEEGKKIIQDSSPAEFAVVMPYLKSSKLGKTMQGQQELIAAVADKMELDKDFDPLEEDDTARVVLCTQCVLPMFNATLQSNKFLVYFCDQVLPQINNLGKFGEQTRSQLLRQLAELSLHCGKLESPSLYVVQIFDKLKGFMPPPPEDADVTELPNLDFGSAECLLYAFHRLARQCPDFLTADPAVLKDFRARLTYFSRGVQGCKKSLASATLDEKTRLAPAVLGNINALIKDLFYTPPVYKCTVTLSFKGAQVERKKAAASPAEKVVQVAQKRHTPITFDGSNGNAKHQRTAKGAPGGGDNVKLYTPPSGKFSNNFQTYDRPRGGRGGGRPGRGGRGRGSWRK